MCASPTVLWQCFETLQMFWSWSENGYIYWGCKSKLPLVKTPPSQNVPELVKTSPNTKKDWSKRPHKTSPSFKGDFSKKNEILTKKKLGLVSGTNV